MPTRPMRSRRRCHHLRRSVLPVMAIVASHQTANVNALLATTQTLKVCPRNMDQCQIQRCRHLFFRRDSPWITYVSSPLFQTVSLVSKFHHVHDNIRKRGAPIMSLSSNPSDYSQQNTGGDKPKPENGHEVNRSKANKASSNDDVQPGGRSTAKGAAASRPKTMEGNDTPAKKQRRRSNYKSNGKYGRRRQRQLPGAKAQSNSESDDSASTKVRKNEDAKKSKNLAPPSSSIPGKISTRFSNTGLKEFTSASHQETQEDDSDAISGMTTDMLKKRVVQLETLVSSQVSELQKLRREIDAITKSIGAFASVVELLQEAGLDIMASNMEELGDGDSNNLRLRSGLPQEGTAISSRPSFEDDMEIFGIAPTTVTDAADAAGSSILSAILAGKQRMLVDVRDAELTRDPALFAEFIELAILPVAAGLEGLDGDEYIRNRVKIVFPTVKEMMAYRKSMTLKAPDVVALSTLGFDPVEEKDQLIVIVAPSPDDITACALMQKLLERTDPALVEPDLRISQPVVIINHHMMPIDTGKVDKFTVVYHLRLLSVQYMTGDIVPEYIGEIEGEEKVDKDDQSDTADEDESALEAAMTHARETGVHQGVTRAMVIRQYPKPWHVFVDTSPDTDADFEVAATFDSEPSQEDVNYSIVECLEGSEREDELVAQQMQAALDAGQLTRVSEMLGISATSIAESVGVSSSDISDSDVGPSDKKNTSKAEERIEWDDLYYDDWLNEDSV